MLQTDPEDLSMTYEEMLRHLLKTYPPGDSRGDELMTSIAADINAVESLRRSVSGYIGTSG
jgi:hypothetical protein